MNRNLLSAIALAVAALSAGQALAQDNAPKTREQVRAELAEAIRTGNMVGDGETGRKLNELYPSQYPAQTSIAQGKTRADVKTELAQAVRNGDLAVDGETGQRVNPMLPARQHSDTVVAQGKTRAEVKAELADAIRNGEMVADGQTGMTFRQMYPGQYPSDEALAAAKAARSHDQLAGDNSQRRNARSFNRLPAQDAGKSMN